MQVTWHGKQEKDNLAGRGMAGTASVLVVACGKGAANWRNSVEEIGITAKNGLETCRTSSKKLTGRQM